MKITCDVNEISSMDFFDRAAGMKFFRAWEEEIVRKVTVGLGSDVLPHGIR